MFVNRRGPAQELLDASLSGRVLDRSADAVCSLEQAQQIRERWRSAGRFTVFNAGAYDLLGLNHVRGLVQCRTIGAMTLLGMEEIKTSEDLHAVHRVAASNSVALMLTVDTDRALEDGKSRRPEKGGAPKPTLSWETRAAVLGAQYMPGVGNTEGTSIVDYITRHGPGCCNACTPGDCTNEDNAKMIVSLQPDVVIVSSGSRQTISDLSAYKSDGLLPDVSLVEIDEQEGAYHDHILEGPISTTAIINRIRS